MDEDLLDPDSLANYLGLPIATIYAMNSKGTGPRRVRIGKHVRYRRSDVEAWLNASIVSSDA